MTDEEKREIARNSYYAQLEMLGYKPDGTPKDMVEVVRCKECIHRGKAEKCVLAAIAAEKDFPLFMLDNRGEWYCADGKREAEEEKTERNEENVR